jgi:gamma-glutamyltranspeptidase/glutathione hydrolase
LQARYGALRWQQTLAPAEKLASLGVEAGPAFLADAGRANLSLTRSDGARLREGDTLKQEGSGAILAQIRVRGAGDLYTGRLADHLVRAGLPSAELAGYTPAWQDTLKIRTEEGVVHFPATSAGRMGQAVWTAIAAAPDRAIDPARRLALAHGAGAQALASLSAGVTVDAASDTGSTGFLVTDGFGGAVACSLTMGGLFGTGATLGDLDILGARPVTPQSVLALSMAPMIDLNTSRNDVAGILVASGSPGASVDGVSVLYGGLAAKKPLQQVLAEPRSLDDGAGQPGSPAAADWVSAMICPDGLKKASDSCRAARDPRSGGIVFQVAK